MTPMVCTGLAALTVLAAVTAAPPAIASDAADTATTDRLVMHGCSDTSLVLPIEDSRAAAVVPAGYTVSMTAGHAILYVSVMKCEAIATGHDSPAPGTLQLVSIGVAAPGATTSLQPPIGPGRRDSYLLAALTDHPSLLRHGRHQGLPVVAGSPTSAAEERTGLRQVHTAVADGRAPITITGEVTEAGSPVHQHELHYWHEDGKRRTHMALDIEMVDRPGAGRWESPPGSLVARLADRATGSTPLFLNSNEVSGSVSSHDATPDRGRRSELSGTSQAL